MAYWLRRSGDQERKARQDSILSRCGPGLEAYGYAVMGLGARQSVHRGPFCVIGSRGQYRAVVKTRRTQVS